MTKKIGTPLYIATELLEDKEHYGTGIDVYAFGILAYEIVTGIEPFSEKRKPATLKTLVKNFPENITEKMKELVSRCWSRDAKERPTFDEIFQLLSTDFSY